VPTRGQIVDAFEINGLIVGVQVSLTQVPTATPLAISSASATPPATALPKPKPALFAEIEVLLHLGHLGPASADFAGSGDLSRRSSQVGENRSMKALLQPHRMHIPSLIE
jgi:hypothetical protein